MNYQFSQLSSSEYDQLIKSLPLIAILIGGADSELDEKELDKARKIADIRTYSTPEYMQPFYEDVDKLFSKNVDDLLQEFPTDTDKRNELINARLIDLNPVLAKLTPKIGAQLYKGYLRFAQEIAKSSGGFLGFMSVNSDEAKWLALPMLHPIDFDDDEEE